MIYTFENIRISEEAIVKEWADYEDRRREVSQRVYGHTRAACATVSMPTPATLAAAVLHAVDRVAFPTKCDDQKKEEK